MRERTFFVVMLVALGLGVSLAIGYDPTRVGLVGLGFTAALLIARLMGATR